MVRQLTFVWWQGLTVVFAVIGAFVAAWRLRGHASYTIAASFALVTAWTTLVVTMTLFNFTFLFGTYSVLPLFAIVIAVPTPMSDTRRRGATWLALALLLCFGGVRAAKLVRAGVTWSARNPARLERFIETHVPPGSEVMGPLSGLFLRRRAERVALPHGRAGQRGGLGALDPGNRASSAAEETRHESARSISCGRRMNPATLYRR